MNEMLNWAKGPAAVSLVTLITLSAAIAGVNIVSAQATRTTDLPANILASSSMTNLVTANANMTSASAQVQTASGTVSTITSQFNTAQANLVLAAMNQGAGTAINYNQITDATKIVPDAAKTLIGTSLSELQAQGVVIPQQVTSSEMIRVADIEAMIKAIMTDRGMNVNELSRGIGYQELPMGESGTVIVPADPGTVFQTYGDMIGESFANIDALQGAITRDALATAINAGIDRAMTASGFTPVGSTPATTGAAFLSSFNLSIDNAFKDTITQALMGLSGEVAAAQYEAVFASTIQTLTGFTNATAITNALGSATAAGFTSMVQTSVQQSIIDQIQVAQNLISPDSINLALGNLVQMNPGNAVVTEARAYAEQLVNSALQNGGVSLTQIQSAMQFTQGDVTTMIQGVLRDNNITTLTGGQLDSVINNTLNQFAFQQGKMTVDDIKNLIGGQLSTALGGTISVQSLVSGMGAETLAGIQGGIQNALVTNLVGDMTSMSAMLGAANFQDVVANSVLSVTGIGDLSAINASISNLGLGQLTNLQGDLQGLVNSQLSSLTSEMTAALSSANIEQLISTNLTSLTGMGNIMQVESLLNNSVGQALSQVTQIGGQLNAITQSYANALSGITGGLDALTSTFNGTLSGLSSLSQLNLASLTGDLSGMIGNLTGQITGQLNGIVSNLTGTVDGIISSGLASIGDLGSLTSSLGNIGGSLTSALGSADGISSLMSGIPGISNLSQRPFGGTITSARYCTCTGDVMITVGGIPQFSGVFLYKQGRSQLYPMYQIYRRGPRTLGIANNVPTPCIAYVGFSCSTVGAGLIISKVGTSR